MAVALLIGCFAVMGVADHAAGRERSIAQMKRLLVIAGGKAAHPRVGSYCLRSGGTAPGSTGTRECNSISYDPRPRPIFHVSARSTVVMCAEHAATRVRLALVHDSSRGPKELAARRARQLDSSGQCWRAKLPRRLRNVTSLDVRVTYGSAGYAHFVPGIRVRD